MTRRDVFNECKRINSLAPEDPAQAERILAHALDAVSNPMAAPMHDRECLLLNRAIKSIRDGKFYQACLIVGDAMTPSNMQMPDPRRLADFEPLSVAELQVRFESAIEAQRQQST